MTALYVVLAGLLIVIGGLAWWYFFGGPAAERHERDRRSDPDDAFNETKGE